MMASLLQFGDQSLRVLSFLILLIPAAYTWWYGRRVLRYLDDPQLAELNVRKAVNVGSAIGLCIGFSLVLSFEYTGMKMLLAVLGVSAADYGYRRVMFAESWSFPTYFGHVVRFGAATLGTWILIALQPELIRAASNAWGPDAWGPVAVGLALTTLIATQAYAWLLRRLLPARDIDHPDLAARFAQVLMRARCRVPWIARGGPQGGFWLNALAVPSVYRQGVILSNDLLASLGPRETTAIFAHEVAHLEELTRRRVLLGQLFQLAFVAVVLGMAFWLGPQSVAFRIFAGVWPLAVLIYIHRRAPRSQEHEHASDLRALELCGDARALIDGLSKLHLLSRMPRRWDAGLEVQLSHPSLAQRLRAIRTAAGLEPPRVTDLTIRVADGSERTVTLTADRLCWPDGRSILYSDLTDLRLVAGGGKTRQLVATDRGGSSMRIPIALADVPAAEAALARIDLRLPGTAQGMSQAAAAASTSTVWVRIDAVLLMLLGVLSPSSGTLSLASLLVLIRPAQANLAAAGTIAVACAFIGLGTLEAPIFEDTTRLLLIGGWAWLGGTFLWFAARRYRARLEEPAWTLWAGLATLGSFAAISLGLGANGLTSSLPITQLHMWARRTPAAALLLLGIVAMLLTVRRRAARAAAAIVLLIPAALATAATPWFRDRFSQDTFIAGAPPLTLTTQALTKTRELAVDGYALELLVSPSGDRVAYARESDDGYSSAYHVELPGGSFASVEASTLDFLDDWRVVAVTDSDDATTLQVIDLFAGATPVIEIALPPCYPFKLRLDREVGRWQVLAHAREGEALIHLTGTVTGSLESTVRHPTHEDDLWTGGDLALDGQGRLLTTYYDAGLGPDVGSLWIAWMFSFLAGTAPTSEITLVDGNDRTVLARTTSNTLCFDPPTGQSVFVCAAGQNRFDLSSLLEDDTTTHLWSVDSGGGSRPLGSVHGLFTEGRAAGDGRIFLGGYASPPVIVDVDAGTAAGFSRHIAAEPALAPLLRETIESFGDDENAHGNLFANVGPSFAFHSGVLGVAFPDEETSTILVYRLP